MTDTGLVCGHIRQIEVDDSHWKVYRDKVKDRLGYRAPGVREMS